MSELLPCPFCGGKPQRKRRIAGMATVSHFIMEIRCLDCPAKIIGTGHYKYVAKNIAEAAWNQRSE